MVELQYTVFNNSFRAKSALNSTPSTMTDDGDKNLATSGIDATGALAILNFGSFNTFVVKLLHHSKGSNSFTCNNEGPEGVKWELGLIYF